MASKKLRETRSKGKPRSVDPNAEFWLLKFVPAFQRTFLDDSTELPQPGTISDLHDLSIRAVLSTLADSGMTPGAIIESVGRALNDLSPAQPAWNSTMNKRRFSLIDKHIQQSISLDEQLELAQLTAAMRQHVDSEANLAMQGARALHNKLLAADGKDQGN